MPAGRRTGMRRLPPALVLVCLLVLTSCATEPPAPTAQDRPVGWTRLAPPPVSPRTSSTVAWTGKEALFLGGTTQQACPPGASCGEPDETARDGAAYDPVAQTWRRTAPAPVDLPGFGQAPVVGDSVFQVVGEDLLVYDASDDAWSVRAGPPGAADGFSSLASANGKVIAVRGQQRGRYQPDQVYDPATGTWTALPRDPLVPMFGRHITATPHGLVLTGSPEVDQPGSQLATSLARAAVLDEATGQWRRLPTSGQLGHGPFTWTGERLVCPTLGGADGGEVNGFGRTVPYGGALSLPSGTWGALPGAPAQGTGGWPVYALDGPRIVTSGWLYDDGRGTWTRVPKPEGGPERPGAAVWAGDLLVVLGGDTTSPHGGTGSAPTAGTAGSGLSDQAFAYRA